MHNPKSDLPQGTLDLLILKVVALGPLHGYAIAQRLQQISRDVVQVPRWREVALWWPQRKALVVAEAVGTGRYFAVGPGPVGVHPWLFTFAVQ